jgi:hypothetical protein
MNFKPSCLPSFIVTGSLTRRVLSDLLDVEIDASGTTQSENREERRVFPVFELDVEEEVEEKGSAALGEVMPLIVDSPSSSDSGSLHASVTGSFAIVASVSADGEAVVVQRPPKILVGLQAEVVPLSLLTLRSGCGRSGAAFTASGASATVALRRADDAAEGAKTNSRRLEPERNGKTFVGAERTAEAAHPSVCATLLTTKGR